MSFTRALEILLKHEGGYVNHPKDPGGMTNLGVTRRVWERWVGRRVGEKEMRSLTAEQVAPLYKKRYWNAVHADELPWGLALQVFDFGVNAGPRRAVQTLQRSAGTIADGIYGPLTRKAINNYIDRHGLVKLIEVYAANRIRYYRSLKTFRVFGKGWTRRTHEVMEVGRDWALQHEAS